MQYRKMGSTDLRLSEISLGCWTLGGRNWSEGHPIGWADVNEEEAIDAVRYAVDQGVNHFDNADVYGNGRAERLLARALRGGLSDRVCIATKVGHFPGTAPHAYTPLNIRHQCEQSLENLERDHIDIYYFHHGDFGPDDRYLDGAVAEMEHLRKAGKIRFIGLSAYSEDDFERLVPRIRPDVLQARTSYLNDRMVRPGNRVPKLMQKHGLSMVCFSPFERGLLLDKWKPGQPPEFVEGDHRRGRKEFEEENIERIHGKLEEVKKRFGGTTEDLARVAVQFLIAHDCVVCPIVGFRSVSQVKTDLAGAGKHISKEDAEWLRNLFAS